MADTELLKTTLIRTLMYARPFGLLSDPNKLQIIKPDFLLSIIKIIPEIGHRRLA